MVFSSLLFIFRFLPIVLILYFIFPKKFRNITLFLVSLVFYAWGEPVYIVIMLFSTIVDYVHGRVVEFYLIRGERKKAKWAVCSSVIINVLLLCFFKYADFIIGVLNSVLRIDIPLLKLALPIGISFYTFQTMSYTIDVYRGQAKAQKSIISFGTYVTLFPQLIAGPIVQYKTIAQQLTDREESFDKFGEGARRFLIGLGKKVLLANNVGLVWQKISGMELQSLPVINAWIGAFAFAFQIYFDFSGYSDMAIGLGKMFGFDFLENFNYPYMSKSITEFWRRWHISLGTWFREYVYIPLGGNRGSSLKQLRNIAIVWFLTGLWHGANWNFICWGLYFGVLLVLEKFVIMGKIQSLPNAVGHIYTVGFVLFSWVIFAFESMQDILGYFCAMFGTGRKMANETTWFLLKNNFILFIIMLFAVTDYPKKIYNKVILSIAESNTKNLIAISALELLLYGGLFLSSIAYLVDDSYNPFLYFRF